MTTAAMEDLYRVPPLAQHSVSASAFQQQPQQQQQQQRQRAWHLSYEDGRDPLSRQRVSLPEASQAKHLKDAKDFREVDFSTCKPLQQQLFQHRLQQKRQLLQKQAAFPRQSYPCELTRRQMVRQASYKMAQTQPVLPPLPPELASAPLVASAPLMASAPLVASSAVLQDTMVRTMG